MEVASCPLVEVQEAWVLQGPQREGVLEEGVVRHLAWLVPSLAWVEALGAHVEGREAGQRGAFLVGLQDEGVSILVGEASCLAEEACQGGQSVGEACQEDEGACRVHLAMGVGASQGEEGIGQMGPDFGGCGM